MFCMEMEWRHGIRTFEIDDNLSSIVHPYPHSETGLNYRRDMKIRKTPHRHQKWGTSFSNMSQGLKCFWDSTEEVTQNIKSQFRCLEDVGVSSGERKVVCQLSGKIKPWLLCGVKYSCHGQFQLTKAELRRDTQVWLLRTCPNQLHHIIEYWGKSVEGMAWNKPLKRILECEGTQQEQEATKRGCQLLGSLLLLGSTASRTSVLCVWGWRGGGAGTCQPEKRLGQTWFSLSDSQLLSPWKTDMLASIKEELREVK